MENNTNTENNQASINPNTMIQIQLANAELALRRAEILVDYIKSTNNTDNKEKAEKQLLKLLVVETE